MCRRTTFDKSCVYAAKLYTEFSEGYYTFVAASNEADLALHYGR